MTKVGHIKSQIGLKCDRTSPLGNPFSMQGEWARDGVCDAYAKYFDAVVTEGISPDQALAKVNSEYGFLIPRGFMIPSRETFMEALSKIGEHTTLLCWCAPKRCHCDTIAEFVNQKNAPDLTK